MEKVAIEFKQEHHARYLNHVLRYLPFQSVDSTRGLIAFFAISGLDILDKLQSISEEEKKNCIEWIYSLQVFNDEDLKSGFQGSTTFITSENKGLNTPYQWGHIAGTYTSLCSLLILGDDLSMVNRKGIIQSLRPLQLSNGCFKGAPEGVEDDMRFVYCTACICYILNDWSGIDVDKMVEFILKSISYDGGIGQGPDLEGHCGSTFCALAALSLSSQLHRLSKKQFQSLNRWLVNRLDLGFNGRPNKREDTCYSFWAGGALKILHQFESVDPHANRDYVLMTQDKYGGFAKYPNTKADPLHTYFGLAGLSILGMDGLRSLFCDLSITERAHDHLKKLHKMWLLETNDC